MLFSVYLLFFQLIQITSVAKSKIIAETSSNGCGALLRYNQKEYILRQQNRLYKFENNQKQCTRSIKLQSAYQDQIICVCDNLYYEFSDNQNQITIDLKTMKKVDQKISIPGIVAKNCVYCQFGNFLMIVDNNFLYALDLVHKELFKLTKLRKLYKEPKSVYISGSSEICIAYDRFYTVFDTINHTWSETTTNEQQKAQMFLSSNTSYLQFPDTKKTQYILMRQRNNGEPTTVYINKKSMFKNCRAFFQNNMMYTVDNCGTIRTLFGKQISLICKYQDRFGHFKCDVQDEEEIDGQDEDFEEQTIVVGNKKQIKLVKKFQSIKPKKTKRISDEQEPKPSQRPRKLEINDFSAQQAEKITVDNVKQEQDTCNYDLQEEKIDESLVKALETSKKYTQQEVKIPTAKRIHPLLEQSLDDYESQLTNMKAIQVLTLTDRQGKEIYLHLNEFLPFQNDKELVEGDIGLAQDIEVEEAPELENQEVKQLERFPIIFPANSDLEFTIEDEFKPMDNINIEIQHQKLLITQDGQQQKLQDITDTEQQLKQVELDVQQVKLQRQVIVMPEIKRVGGYVPTYENEFQPFDKRILDFKAEAPEVDKKPINLQELESQETSVQSVQKPQLQLADLTLSKEKVGHAKPKQYSKPMLRTRGGGLNTANQKIGGGQ